MLKKALANQLFILALVLSLTLGLPLRLAVFLVLVTAAVALLSNWEGMEVAGLGLAVGSFLLTLAEYEPNVMIWLVFGLLVAGGWFSVITWKK